MLFYEEVEKALLPAYLQGEYSWLGRKSGISVIGLINLVSDMSINSCVSNSPFSGYISEWVNSPSTLLSTERCFFASVCISVPL